MYLPRCPYCGMPKRYCQCGHQKPTEDQEEKIDCSFQCYALNGVTWNIDGKCSKHGFVKNEDCPVCEEIHSKKFTDKTGRRRKFTKDEDDEDYLDSTRCEFSKTEYQTMKTRRLVLKNRQQQLKIDLCKCNEELHELDRKIAIADKEQELRKKIRRETRELIPSLVQVQNKAKEIKKNISEITKGNDDGSDDELFPPAEDVLKGFLTQN